MKHIIFGNYGTPTLALIQWAYEQQLPELSMVSVNTAWAAAGWQSQLEQGQKLAAGYGIQVVELKPKMGFAEQVRDRQEFPSRKFQWCPLFLKGLPFLEWLDEVDPRCLSTIVLPKRRSVVNPELPEFIGSSEHYGERRVWQPLFAHNEVAMETLVTRAGFIYTPHQRSLECDPCIYDEDIDFQRLSEEDRVKLSALEAEIGKPMFAEPMTENSLHQGCADPYACGV